MDKNNSSDDKYNYKEYRKNILEKLEEYKTNYLDIKEQGTYKGEKYKHILPKKQEKSNLISPLDNLYGKIKKEIKFHRCFRHLNSSQALTINYFYPFKEGIMDLDKSDLNNILREFIGLKSNISSMELEKVSDKEKSDTTKTNFDVYMETADNEKVYIEAKYTEEGFGKANYKSKTVLDDNKSIIMAKLLAEKIVDDDKYIKKFEVYKNVVDQYNLKTIINPKYLKMTNFYDNYQIMRNLLHIDKDSFVYFIIPCENKSAESELKIIEEVISDDSYKSRIGIIYWEDLLSVTLMYLKEYNKVEAYNYFGEFAEKYFSGNTIK